MPLPSKEFLNGINALKLSSLAFIFALSLISFSSKAQFNYDVSRAAYAGTEERFVVSGQETGPVGLTFNPTGTKMFIIGTTGRDVNQYTLSTPFDVSTASFDNVTFSVFSQELTPYSVVFNNDGTKMFVLGSNSDNINQYSLAVGYNIATATYDGDAKRFNVSAQESSPSELAFNADGTKLFVLGTSGDDINQYTLSSPYDVSTAIYDGDAERFSVSSQETSPFALKFNNDGTKMYVLGNSGDDINQYTLSAPYDVSTAVFDGNEERLYVGGLIPNPLALSFNADGSKFFVMGSTSDAVHEFSLSNLAPEIDGAIADQLVNDRSTVAPFSGILINEPNGEDISATITLDDNTKGVLSGAGLTGTGPYSIALTDEASLRTTLSQLLFDPTDDRVSAGSTETTIFTLAVSDGVNTTVNSTTSTITTTNPSVLSIELAGTPSAFDASVDFTVTFAENVTGVDISDFTLNTSPMVTANLVGVTGSDDVYTVTVGSISGDGTISVDLNTGGTGIQDGSANLLTEGFIGTSHLVGFAFNPADGAYALDEQFYVGNQEGTPTSLVFNPNGTKMFIIGNSTDEINQYSLATAYDISSATFDGDTESFSVRAQEGNPYGLAFNSDGTQMFVVGENNDFVNQYTLLSPYDVSTASYDGDAERFFVGAQETSPTDLAFNPDGTKLFIVGAAGNDISQYSLTAPFDVSTAIYDGDSERLFLGSQEGTPFGVWFAPGGTKLFTVGSSGDNIYRYTLAIPYDVSTGVYDGNEFRRSVNSLDTSPYGVAFNPDGTKMFLVGAATDIIHEFSLTNVAPEIIGTVSEQEINDRSTIALFEDIVIIERNNQDVSTTITLDNNDKGVLSGDDLTGTGPYTIVANSAANVQNILRNLIFDPTDDRVPAGSTETTTFTIAVSDGSNITTDNATTVVAGTNPVVESILISGDPGAFDPSISFIVTFQEAVTGVDISDFSLNTTPRVSASITDVTGSDDVYTVTIGSITGDGIIGLNLNASGTGIQDAASNPLSGGFQGQDLHAAGFAYDVSNAAYDGDDERLLIQAQEATPTSIVFTPNGTKMFIIGSSGDEINEYDLSAPFDVSTAIHAGNEETFSVASQEANPYGLAFNDDGTKMFVIGESSDRVNQYSLSTAYDVSTAVYDGTEESFSVSSQDTSPTDLVFTPDGMKLFVVGNSGNDINQYSLTNPYDVSTAIYDGDSERFAVGSQEGTPFSMVFNINGTKMYVMGSSSDNINSYTLTTAYDVSTAIYDGNEERLFLNSLDGSPFGLAFNNDGTQMYVVGADADAIYQFSLFDVAPEINGALAGQEVNDRSTIAPFSEIEIIEGNNQNVSATITLDNNDEGTLSGDDLLGTGPYTIESTSAIAMEEIIRELIFDPTDDLVSSGSAETTTFSIAVNDGTFTTTNNETTVITRTNPAVDSIIVAGTPGRFDNSVNFTIKFNENVTGVDISDFTLTTSPLVSATISGITGSGDEYTVTVNSITGDGFLGIDLKEGNTGIRDESNNVLLSGFLGQEYHLVGFAYDIANAAYTGSEERLYVGSQETNPQEIVFIDNGLKMLLLGSTGDDISLYDLTTAYDISTAVFDSEAGTFSVNELEATPNGLAFNNDGSKMFIIGESSDNVIQYSLSTPYDVFSADYDGNEEGFNVASEESNPTDLAFNPDGTKLFILGNSGNDINEYDLESPFDVSTAVYFQRFSVGGEESTPRSLLFSIDGRKMFVLGSSGDDISQYSLSIPYDISTAEYDGIDERLYVGTVDSNPFGMAFNEDGTKLFIVGASSDAVYEYSLFNVAPEISGALTDLEINDRSTIMPFSEIEINDANNQDLSATITLDDNVKGVLSGDDLSGTGPYTVAATSIGELQDILRAISFNPTDDRISSGSSETTTFTLTISDGSLTAMDNSTTVLVITDPTLSSIEVDADPFDTSVDFIVTFGESVAGVDISDFTLTASSEVSGNLTGFSGSDDVYTLTVTSVSGDGVLGINLKTSGTGIQDLSGNELLSNFDIIKYHYVGFAYDLANAAYAGDEESLSIANQEFNPHDLAFTPDGLKMFLLGSSGDDISQYNLSTAFDVSTAVFDASGTFSVNAQEGNPYGLAFNNDGTKMFIIGENSDFVSQYTLSTPYNVLSASYDGDEERFSVANEEISPTDLAFNLDGTKLFVIGFSSDRIHQYTLASPFDVSEAVYDGADQSFSVSGQENAPRSFTFSIDGLKLFVAGSSGDDVNAYTLTYPYEVASAVFDGNEERLLMGSQDGSPFGITIKPDGTKLFMVGASNDVIFEYSLFDVAPEISGTITDQEVNDRSTVFPFQEIVIAELNNQDVSATITLDNNAKGVLTGGVTGTGPYTINSTDPEIMTDILRGIEFNPTDDQVTSSTPETTRFTITISDGNLSTIDNTTTTITTTDPQVVSISLDGDPSQFDNSVDFIVVFEEAVTGVDVSDFALYTSGQGMSASITNVSGSDDEYTVEVGSISGDGIIRVDLASSGSSITDLAGNALVAGFEDGEYHYSGYAYDVSAAIYAGDEEGLSVGSQERTPTSIRFNPDGTKMFLIGSSGDEVNQYSLTTPYDISTAVYDNVVFSLRSQESTPYGLAFNTEGSKMFVVGASGDYVYQYTLTTPFDISEVTYDGFNEGFSVRSQDSSPRDLNFSNDGYTMFVVGRTYIFSYTLDKPFDVSTAVYDGTDERFLINSQEGNPFALAFNPDGTKMYMTGNSNRYINSYTLAVPFVLSTATYDGSDERFDSRGQNSNPLGLAFKPDGTKMFIIDNGSDFINEYDLLNVAPELANPIVKVEVLEDDDIDFEVPGNVFEDLNFGTEFTYETSLEGGGSLPDWLTFDEGSSTFTGIPENDDVGTFFVQLTAFDQGGASAMDVFEIEVINTNDAPVMEPISDQTATEGITLNFFAEASDVDLGDTFTWTVDEISRDKGIVTFSNGEISWKPLEGYDGPNEVTVTVTDAGGLSDSQTLTITVLEGNNAPMISPIRDREIIAPTTLSIKVNAIDRDPIAQILAYSLDDASESKGMNIDAATGSFSWTVDANDVGIHEVSIIVTDGEAEARETFTIRVRQVNVAPVLGTIGNQTVAATNNLTFTATATDANPDETLVFNLTGSTIPTGISFNQNSGLFSWTPLADQAGMYELTLSVSDGLESDSETFSITVEEKPLSAEPELAQEVVVYPNPVQHDLQITVSGSERGTLSIQIYDLNGQLIMNQNTEKADASIELTMDISELNSGVYVLKTTVGSTENKPVNIIKLD